MLTPEIKTLLILGDLLLGFLIFFPTQRFFLLLRMDIYTFSPKEQIQAKGFIFAITFLLLASFWAPLVNYFYYIDTPSEIRNLAINTSSYYRESDEMRGLLIEFGVRWNDVDPVSVTVQILNTSENRSDVWWYIPGYKINDFDENKIRDFNLSSDKEFFGGHKLINPPSFMYYSLGTPLTPENSLYLWFWSPEIMGVEKIVFQNENYHVKNGKIVLDRR